MARIIISLFVIILGVYLTEQAYFLQQEFIDNINDAELTWKVSNVGEKFKKKINFFIIINVTCSIVCTHTVPKETVTLQYLKKCCNIVIY